MKGNGSEKKKFLVETAVMLAVFFLLAIILAVLDAKLGTDYFPQFMRIVPVALCLWALVELFGLFLLIWRRIRKRVVSHFFFLGAVLVTVLVPCVVHFIFFSEEVLTEDIWLGFYGDFIAFVGTVFLGYIVYRRDAQIRKDEKLNKAKLLNSVLERLLEQMHLLGNNPDRVNALVYDPNWREYYNEIAFMIKKDEVIIRHKIELIFCWADAINFDLQHVSKEAAIKRYRSFIKSELYSSGAYNYSEVSGIIYEIAYLSEYLPKYVRWDEEPETKDNIEKYSKEFFGVINQAVYNRLVECPEGYLNASDIEYEMVDWLMTHPDLKALVKIPSDKRIVTRIFKTCCLQMNKKSGLVNYYWDELSLK